VNSGVRWLKTQVLGTPSREWRSGEIFGAVHLRGQVAEIGDLVNSGVRRVKTQVLGVQSREARGREATKEREIVAIHLRRTGGERSMDLASSGARRLRVQTFGTPSREVARKREKDSRWIQNTGGPLDLSEGSCLGTSQEKVREFGHGDREVAR
jgi:hypothetical protein